MTKMTFETDELCNWLAGSLDPDRAKAIEDDLRRGDASRVMAWLRSLDRATKNMQRRRSKEYVHRTLGISGSDEEEDGDLMVRSPSAASTGPEAPPEQPTNDAAPGTFPAPAQEQPASHDPAGPAGLPRALRVHLLDPEKERLLQTALKADVPTLLAAIGYFVDRAKVALAPPDRQQLRATGEAWFAGRQGELGALLRQDPTTWTLLSSAKSEITDVPGTARRIVELILPACGEIPATHVAVLLIKRKLGG